MFWLLSLLSGIYECGFLFVGLQMNLPIWQILCYPLAYQCGNLFPLPLSMSRRKYQVLSLLAMIFGGALLFRGIPHELWFGLSLVSLFGVSTGFQAVRSEMKSEDGRLKKRVFRVLGFVLTPLIIVAPGIFLIVGGALAYVNLKHVARLEKISCRTIIKNSYAKIMFWHQMHYFTYAYGMILLSFMLFDNKYLSMCLFAGTWITYMLVEPIVNSCYKGDARVIFFIGHSLLVLILVALFFCSSNMLFVILWLLTGVGGGTVFSINNMAKQKHSHDKKLMTCSENLGHFIGTLLAVLGVLINQKDLKTLILYSVICVFVAMLIEVITSINLKED